MNRFTLPTFVVCLAVARLAHAAALVVSHSGYLLAANDAPLDAPAQAMTFRLFAQATPQSGEVAAFTAACPLAVSNGFYAVRLGEAPCDGDGLEDADLPAGDGWLEITIGAVTLAPRQRLAGAAWARDAGSVGGVAASALVQRAQVEASAGVAVNDGSNVVDWSRLRGVPAGLADGVDADTTYSAAGGISLLGTTFSLATDGSALAAISNDKLTLSAGVVHADGAVLTNPTLTGATISGAGAGLTGVDAARLEGQTLADLDARYSQLGGASTTCGAGLAGALRFNQVTKHLEYCSGAAWIEILDNRTFRSCAEILAKGLSTGSGAYTVDPDGPAGATAPFTVWCNMDDASGGWTLALKAGTSYGAGTPYNASDSGSSLGLLADTSVGSSTYAYAPKALTDLGTEALCVFGPRRIHYLLNGGNTVTAFLRAGFGAVHTSGCSLLPSSAGSTPANGSAAGYCNIPGVGDFSLRQTHGNPSYGLRSFLLGWDAGTEYDGLCYSR